jgi:Na+-transporting NADH:ubiquinone oxidoreductase subunit D
MSLQRVVLDPLVSNNPVTLQVLGVCSALAVTRTLLPALIMSIAVTAVLAFANVSVSLIRHIMPRSIRIIIEVTLIASAVIVVEEVLKAYAPALSRILSVFVGLIITNCIVLGRTETFAMSNGVGASLLDGIGNGVGYSLVLIFVASTRELLGAGSLLGHPVLGLAGEGGWYVPNALMTLPASAFFVIALLIWLVRSWRPVQVEVPEYLARHLEFQETA